MKKAVALALAFGGLFAASPAVACGEDPVPNAIVFANPPSSRPAGSVLLKVEQIRTIPQSYAAVYLVDDGPEAMVGRAYRIAPDNFSSCTGWGRNSGYVAVFTTPRGEASDKFLAAVTYERSWSDYFFSLLGWEPYRNAGDRAIEPRLEIGVAEG
ncbi:hypothetical protein K3172_03755 [Qipengyuania sp. 6B39]|uniref:hypothetical protein n=1 Tax=Qipengyuania proteolytica TaxID=2867239 RepID=UPI001C8994D5|nr:hypothetical protein [Qipengyuania proteolytica]MBX7494970.1 hypothetical protein [Qipengyuania proteolytica]